MIGVLAALAAATAQPDWPDRPPEVVPAGERVAYRAWLTERAIYWESHFSLQPVCRGAHVTTLETRPMDIFGGPPTIAGKGLAEAVRVEGCGRSSRQNIQVYRLRAGGWDSGPRFPGVSNADAQLQTGAMASVRETIGPTLHECPMNPEDFRVGETRIITPVGRLHVVPTLEDVPEVSKGRDPDGTYVTLDDRSLAANLDDEQGWQEYWPLTVCGETRPVVVAFFPMKGASGLFAWMVSPQ